VQAIFSTTVTGGKRMKKMHLLVALLAVSLPDAYATSHHGGHRAGRGASTWDSNCLHPRLDKVQPARLATVAPGSAFSFLIYNIEDPKHVSVEVKRQPVDVKFEFKDPFYVVRGKIPPNLSNTAARIDVKINAKASSCRAAEGWLIKISEK
jgi:hypothetical protein